MSLPEGASAPAAVDVLIVHYRTPVLTAAAVAGLAGAGLRLLVHDNSGDCPTLPGADVVGDGTNLMFAAANNRLFSRGDAPLVLLMNPDVVAAPDVVGAMVERLSSLPGCWGLTVRLVGTDGANQNYLHELPTLAGLLADRLPPLRPVLRTAYRRYRCLDQDLRVSGDVGQPPAAILLVRRQQVEEAGGLFDESYPLFFNDVDLGRRMAAHGRCHYAADLAVSHVGGASVRAAGRRGEPVAALYDQALLTYARRHLRGWRLLWLAVLARRPFQRLLGWAR